MRNHLDILKDIEIILSENNLISEKEEIEKEISASSTGLELLSRCGSQLTIMVNRNNENQNLIGHLTKEFLSYCNSNGIIFTDTIL